MVIITDPVFCQNEQPHIVKHPPTSLNVQPSRSAIKKTHTKTIDDKQKVSFSERTTEMYEDGEIENRVRDHFTKFLNPNPLHILQGPLVKKGNSKSPFATKWKRRWFILTKDGISYYDHIANRKDDPLGFIPVK